MIVRLKCGSRISLARDPGYDCRDYGRTCDDPAHAPCDGRRTCRACGPQGLCRTDWPTRTITIIHGFPAGGPSDIISRLLADNLSRALGQAVIVESSPGAAGTVAAAQVARAAPDGYTLSVIPSGHASAAATFANLPYRSVVDFTTISLASEYPYVMATHMDSGIKS